jgi:predicted HTH transcriptional regulator
MLYKVPLKTTCGFGGDCHLDTGAIRELLMNACMHRDYQANMPIRLYQFDDYIEVMNAGGLYGEARPENFENRQVGMSVRNVLCKMPIMP